MSGTVTNGLQHACTKASLGYPDPSKNCEGLGTRDYAKASESLFNFLLSVPPESGAETLFHKFFENEKCKRRPSL